MNKNYKIFPSSFKDFEIGKLESLPEKVQDNIKEISIFLDRVLNNDEYLEITYPSNGEIEIPISKNINDQKYRKICKLIYDFVIYENPLP